MFLLIVAQSTWVQFFHAQALDNSPLNPRNNASNNQYQRGDIYSANGTVLAESVPTPNGVYAWKRVYPLGSLVSGLVGFSSTGYGEWALEAQYNNYLSAHPQPAQSLEQVLAPTTAPDSVTLTISLALQRVAEHALAGLDGSVVAIDPQTGAILAMYSNPTYNPTPFTSSSFTVQEKAWAKVNTKDAHGYPPLGLMATQQTLFPGSTFKVITTSAMVRYKPSLLATNYTPMVFTRLPDSNKLLYNYGNVACGGNVSSMFAQSCDPGYGRLGLAVGAQDLTAEANAFGYNQVPPIDLPGVVASYFPPESNLAANPPFVAYSAIGQEDVSTTALQNALMVAAIANGGKIMTPHLMSYITGPNGAIVKRFKDSVWKDPLTSSQAAVIIPLMQDVVKYGTASGVGFLPADQVGAKTGTAQIGNNLLNDTDDWMVAIAPASHPTIAVAVSIPFQAYSATGASNAGPIMKCVVEGALAIESGLPATGTSTTCPN
jgi:peptidoglycan glycosyltransferase